MTSLTRNERSQQAANKYKQELLQQMFGFSAYAGLTAAAAQGKAPAGRNIAGVGFGAKISGGRCLLQTVAVRVYVRVKKPRAQLAPGEAVPSTVYGLPTDVIAVGNIVALVKPLCCGVAVRHYRGAAGTLGCLVTRPGQSQEQFIMSNNHVLANANDALQGDAILKLGRPTSRAGPRPIAQLAQWVNLKFDGAINHVDAAIAKVLRAGAVDPAIPGIGRVKRPIMPAVLAQLVRKHGRTTLHTQGVIQDLSADIQVLYGTRAANFDDQLAVQGIDSPFSAQGDSGALIVDAANRRPVGLLFAGGGPITFANPIERVTAQLNVEIL